MNNPVNSINKTTERHVPCNHAKLFSTIYLH